MPTLRVDLREGFLDDTVVVRVDDEEHRRSHVRTQLQTGLADSFEIGVREDAVDVEVALPSRAASTSVPIAFGKADTVYLGLSVVANDEISAQVSHEPFRYL